MTFDSERQLVNSNGDLRDSRSTEIAVPIRMWKFSRKRLAMLVGFMRSADMRSLAQTYTYTYTIIRFFLTSVYAYLTLMAHLKADLHDERTHIFDGESSCFRDGRYFYDLSVDLGYGEYILL